jgi:aryl-alcohol dehydrogenase-like predicted oxidoreductase
MTFGEGGEVEEAEARRVFDAYVDHGGNFIDTAGYYAKGRSEELIGSFAHGKRHQLVISTKYSLAVTPGDPNGCGNGRKSMMRSVEESLRRLGTDHIDLLFLHIWDDTAPADEILRGFDDLVSQGKILYIGLSDTPAWQAARMQTMAELRGWSQFAALQVEYSLLERTTEREMIPAARALGMGVMPWGPLRGGILSGKYATGASASDSARRQRLELSGRVTPAAITVADAVQEVASEIGASSAQVALAWTLANPVVTAPLIGARTLAQLQDNLGALTIALSGDQLARLETISAISPGFPHKLLGSEFVQMALTGGTSIRARGVAT